MAIKQDLEAEARKLADAVREAARAFAEQTGMQADVRIEWVTFTRVEADCSETRVGTVSVDLGGMTVKA